MTSDKSPERDTIDLREVVGVLRRQWRWLAAGTTAGLLAALVALLLLPRSYEGVSTVLLRETSGSSARGQLGALAGLIPSGLGASTGGITTELEILSSRSLVGSIVDDLGLQAEVRRPAGVEASELFASVEVAARVPKKARVVLERRGEGYRVRAGGTDAAVESGGLVRLPWATLQLRDADALPDRVEVALLDRESAIDAVLEELSVEEASAEVARVSYRAGDPETAAAVPNLLVDRYLARRRTTDRGVNQYRYEFLSEHVDSIAGELALAEAALRGQQESSGVFDPEVIGTARLERAMAVQTQLEQLEVESRALQDILTAGEGEADDARRLAAYPTFLNNPAINDVLSRLLALETERVELLGRRTERDPEVMGLTRSIEHLEAQLRSLAREYLNGVRRQEVELRQELSGYRSELAALPAEAEQSLRRQREVRRLTETHLLLQAQLVQARLDAITEGGVVQRIDEAVARDEPVFPKAPLLLVIGLLGGLFAGVTGAFGREYLGERIDEPRQAELAAGIPAVALPARGPLFLRGTGEAGIVLVVPVGEGARAAEVAHRAAETAALQGAEVVVVDLTGTQRALSATGTAPEAVATRSSNGAEAYAVVRPTDAADRSELRGSVHGLLDRYTSVLVVVPALETPETVRLLGEDTTALLAGRAGKVRRAALRAAAGMLDSAGARVAGIVLHNGESGSGLGD